MELNPDARPFVPARAEPTVVDFLGDIRALCTYDSILSRCTSGADKRLELRLAVRAAAAKAAADAARASSERASTGGRR